eukprot:3835533-Amphidinium_carterae.2
MHFWQHPASGVLGMGSSKWVDTCQIKFDPLLEVLEQSQLVSCNPAQQFVEGLGNFAMKHHQEPKL